MDTERFFETTWILFDKTEVNEVWTRTIKLFSCDDFIKRLEIKDGFVVTPSNTPNLFASLISLMSAVSMKNFIVASTVIFVIKVV